MSDIDTIYDLNEKQSLILYSDTISGQTVEVREYEDLRWLCIDGSAVQSLMNITDSGKLLNPVSHILVAGISLFDHVDRLLNLGLGGGSIERFIWQYFPEITIDSVESSEVIIHIAREFFCIPDTAPIFHSTAEQFFTTTCAQYQIILCDIFSGQSHPDCLYQSHFYQYCQQHLSADGIIIINLTPEDERDLLDILLPLRLSFAHTYLYEVDDHSNIIIFAANNHLKERSVHPRHSDTINSHTQLNFDDILKSLVALPAKKD